MSQATRKSEPPILLIAPTFHFAYHHARVPPQGVPPICINLRSTPFTHQIIQNIWKLVIRRPETLTPDP